MTASIIIRQILAERLEQDVAPNDIELVVDLVAEHFLKEETMAGVGAAIEAGRREYAPLFKAAAPPAPPHETMTQRIAREAREASIGTSGEPNPWSKGTANVTMQVMMEARDPARAARLKAEAGAS